MSVGKFHDCNKYSLLVQTMAAFCVIGGGQRGFPGILLGLAIVSAGAYALWVFLKMDFSFEDKIEDDMEANLKREEEVPSNIELGAFE